MTFDFIKILGAETGLPINIKKEAVYKIRAVPDGSVKCFPLAQTEIKTYMGDIIYSLENEENIMGKF